MHLEKAKITFVSDTYTVTNKRTGVPSYHRDFVAQWFDNTTGRYCSLLFTLIEHLSVMSQLAVGKLVTLDFQLVANEWKGKHFNNTRILGDSIQIFAAISSQIVDPPKEPRKVQFINNNK